MSLWLEYSLSLEGATLLVAVKWFTSQAAADPAYSETMSFNLLDSKITADVIRQRVLDQTDRVRRGITVYQDVITKLGGTQNTRIAVG